MYIPSHFEITDPEEILVFIDQNGFGQLVSTSQGKLCCTHMPFFLSEDNSKLVGHLAKPNPQHADLDGQEVLVTLQGPHDYISPSWYETSDVPTWNYQAVHIYGNCRVFDDAEKLAEVVDTLTAKYEAAFSSPWQPDYRVSMLNGIIGVEISISEIQCKYKLSQNRSSQDRGNVADQLDSRGSHDLARAMRCNEV